MTRLDTIAATLLLLATLAACGRERGGSAAGRIDTTTLQLGGPDSGPGRSAPPDREWSNQSVLGFVTTANEGAVQMSKLAAAKATDPGVRSFAQSMATQHASLLADFQRVATKLGLAADTGAHRTSELAEDLREDVQELTDSPPGRNWDEDWLDDVEDLNETMLKFTARAKQRVTDANLRAMLDRVSAVADTSLAKARVLEARIDRGS